MTRASFRRTIAQTYALLGNKKEALSYLKIAFDQRSDGVPEMESARALDNLHDEPAFRQLLAKVGLPPLTEHLAEKL